MKRFEQQQLFEKLQGETGISNDEYYRAYKRVKRIKRFYVHLGVFCFVNAFLIINRIIDANSITALFHWQTYSTLFLWGIGLAAHGISVFGRDIFFGDDWEERKIKELMNKEKANEQNWK